MGVGKERRVCVPRAPPTSAAHVPGAAAAVDGGQPGHPERRHAERREECAALARRRGRDSARKQRRRRRGVGERDEDPVRHAEVVVARAAALGRAALHSRAGAPRGRKGRRGAARANEGEEGHCVQGR